jgi:hypothetical protein
MSNVVPFQPKASVLTAVTTSEPEDSVESRPAFSFDVIQTEMRGMVLIDACVPAAMAVEFLELIGLYCEPAGA